MAQGDFCSGEQSAKRSRRRSYQEHGGVQRVLTEASFLCLAGFQCVHDDMINKLTIYVFILHAINMKCDQSLAKTWTGHTYNAQF